MTLVSITDIQTDDDATAELFNSRLAAIIDVVNGNIDASNIKDNSVTYAKLSLSDGSIPIAKLANLTVNAGTNANTAGGSTNYIKFGELLVCWGTTNAISATASSYTDAAVTFPQTYASAPTVQVTDREHTVSHLQYAEVPNAPSTTVVTVRNVNTSGSTSTAKIDWLAIGKAA